MVVLLLVVIIVICIVVTTTRCVAEPFAVTATYREVPVVKVYATDEYARSLAPSRITEQPTLDPQDADVLIGELHEIMRQAPAARAEKAVHRVWADGYALVLSVAATDDKTPVVKTDLTQGGLAISASSDFAFDLLRAVVAPSAVRATRTSSGVLRADLIPIGRPTLLTNRSIVDYSSAFEQSAGRLSFYAPLATWRDVDTSAMLASQEAPPTRMIALPAALIMAGEPARPMSPDLARVNMYFQLAHSGPSSTPPGRVQIIREVRAVYRRVRVMRQDVHLPARARPGDTFHGLYIVSMDAGHVVLETAWLLPSLNDLAAEQRLITEAAMQTGRNRVYRNNKPIAFPPALRENDRVLFEGDLAPAVVSAVLDKERGLYEFMVFDDRRNDANEFMCYDDPTRVREAECPNGSWDKACEANDECPFFRASDSRGGCVAGFCEMPIGVRRIGFRRVDPTSAAPVTHADGTPAFVDDHVVRYRQGMRPWHGGLVQ